MFANFKSELLKDSISSFDAGVNEGISPLLLQKNQAAGATNVTFRGTYASPRPAYLEIEPTFVPATIQLAVESGLFQGACYYKPDVGPECLMAAISGNLYQFVISGQTATVTQVSTPAFHQDALAAQHWLWQAELYVIWNDGINTPVFYTGSTVAPWQINRSNFGVRANFGATSTTPFTIPAPGSTVTVEFDSNANIVAGDIVLLNNRGQLQVQSKGTPNASTSVLLVNLSATPTGLNIPNPGSQNLFWSHASGSQLPAGRMGAYGMGRNWVSLLDGKQFIASDIEGGASGTASLNYRDSVLSITENNFLVGGGNFSVPGSIGEIRAMRFGATLDASLGQGPLQVFTPSAIFSVNAPVDRTTWQSITNPILTQSLIGNGSLNQNATILVNGDFLFRSYDGVRSLTLARRDFATWGNVPQSREVDPILSKDNIGLLQFGSAVYFDNRMLMTANPQQADQGVYHNTLIALNFDPISSLRGKAPSIYDGQWIGLNVLQLITGSFGGVNRCFAFTLNTVSNTIELWEITKSQNLNQNGGSATYPIWDNSDPQQAIVLSIESASLFNKHPADPTNTKLKRLIDGEIMVDNLIGTVDFQVFWKPDQWPCWVPWFAWTECSDPASTTTTKPAFRPRMGLGEPPATYCDEANNRPLREGYTHQIKITGRGHWQFKGAHFKAVTVAQDEFAKPRCCQQTPPPPPSRRPITVVGDTSGGVVFDGSQPLGG